MFQEWGFLISEMFLLIVLAALLGLLVGWIVWGRRRGDVTVGAGLQADLETDPVGDRYTPLPDGTYYGVDYDSAPVLNSYDIGSPLLPFWVAFNVPPSDAGAYAIEVTHPERECTVLHPSFPTLPRYVTLVDVDCPPPP